MRWRRCLLIPWEGLLGGLTEEGFDMTAKGFDGMHRVNHDWRSAMPDPASSHTARVNNVNCRVYYVTHNVGLCLSQG